MRKKVAIVIPSLRGGGAERVMVNIANHLDRERFLFKLIVIKKEGPYIDKLSSDIDVVDLNSDRVRHSIGKLIKVLNEFEPDTILSTLGHLNLILLGIRKFLSGSPKIIVRETTVPSKTIGNMKGMQKKVFKLFYQKLYPTADKIIAQCQEMKKDIHQFIDIKDEKITYIYNPIDVDYITASAKEFNPYDEKKINIVAIGRLAYQKGFDILIDAFKKVIEVYPSAKLTILGDGDLKEELLTQIEENELHEYIEILGFKDNPYPYYKYADLYVLSSRWEGFPNTMLESLTCGTKIVATKCKSGPQEILEANNYGNLVEVDNSTSLANGIINILQKDVEIPNEASLQYDVNKVIKEYEALL